jgi:hypothetical protein
VASSIAAVIVPKRGAQGNPPSGSPCLELAIPPVTVIARLISAPSVMDPTEAG